MLGVWVGHLGLLSGSGLEAVAAVRLCECWEVGLLLARVWGIDVLLRLLHERSWMLIHP